MAKRFIDLSTLPKAWRKLKPSLKLTWYYLWNNCDSGGVWVIDEDLFEFENGFELDVKSLEKNLGDLIEFNEEKVLLTNFISVNQCDISKLNENYNPHKPVFRSIKKHDLKLNPSLNQASLKLVVGVGVEVEDEVVVTFEKSEKLLDKSDEFLKTLCDYFSLKSEEQEIKANGFLRQIRNQGKLEEFKSQTESYIAYKKLSKEKSHGWFSYQTQWNDVDWTHKLSKIKSIEVESTLVHSNR